MVMFVDFYMLYVVVGSVKCVQTPVKENFLIHDNRFYYVCHKAVVELRKVCGGVGATFRTFLLSNDSPGYGWTRRVKNFVF